MTRLLRFYKPFGVLCQFRDPDRTTLSDFIEVPGVYVAGRLDFNSEGLLLLTDSGPLQARISDPRHKLPKTYAVQVEGAPDSAALAALVSGVLLNDGPAYAEYAMLMPEPDLPPRVPPVTPHRDANSSWVEVVLTSGRNRQVRRMLAAVGHPVLRLVRTRIGPWDIEGLVPGEWQDIAATDLPGSSHQGASHEGARRSDGARSPGTTRVRSGRSGAAGLSRSGPARGRRR